VKSSQRTAGVSWQHCSVPCSAICTWRCWEGDIDSL